MIQKWIIEISKRKLTGYDSRPVPVEYKEYWNYVRIKIANDEYSVKTFIDENKPKRVD